MTAPAPITLDVRPELRSGGEPFARIMQAVGDLAPGQGLRLLATFEPIPLYALLGRKGLAHRAIHHGEADWEILFTPEDAIAPPAPHPPAPHPEPGIRAAGEGADLRPTWPAPADTLDNRGLPPPEPMLRILSTLERLAPGAVLEAWTDREPLHLYPELEARGAAIRMSRETSGVRLLIRRGG